MEEQHGDSDEDNNSNFNEVFRIEKSESPYGGLGLRANCFIDPGTVVLTEQACLVGPSTPYACIECLAAVVSTSECACISV